MRKEKPIIKLKAERLILTVDDDFADVRETDGEAWFETRYRKQLEAIPRCLETGHIPDEDLPTYEIWVGSRYTRLQALAINEPEYDEADHSLHVHWHSNDLLAVGDYTPKIKGIRA